MYLKRLELHGFKSFAHKTVLDFDDGVTCIVGPNGCGKSNIVDAVRWAVGEQRARALRSEKMENVIFNGTSKRRALGMAEVLLTVENTRGVLPVEFTEVTLGRRLYRSGESEYLLNGVACRLRDIQDLFMDTGMGAGAYSVIELSMVEEILSENADDRRRLFEEAAGITRYKLRRRQALGKLDGTQQDLTRLRDLTDEIGGSVRSLKRQADKAERFRDFEARREALERALLVAEHVRLSGEQRALAEAHQALTDAAEGEAADVATREARLEKQSAERLAREETRRARQEALHALLGTLRTLEADRRLVDERLSRLDAEKRRLHDELAEGEARRNAQRHVAVRFEDELTRAEPLHATARRALEQADAERRDAQDALAEVRREAQEARAAEARAERALADAHRALDRLHARRDLGAAERARLQAEAEAEPPAAHDARLAPAEMALDEAARSVEQAAHAREQAEAARADAEALRRTLADERRTLESRRSALAAEKDVLERLVASYEGFSEAVQALVGSTPDLVTVADVLHAEEGWQGALSAALGPWHEAVIVRDAAAARAALRQLENAERGAALLVVLDELPSDLALPADALAARVEAAAEAYRPVRDALLAGWTTAATLDEARARAAARGGRVVTPGGFWADGQGRLRGGSLLEGTGAPSRADQRARVADLEAALGAMQEAFDALAAREDGVHARLAALDFPALRQAEARAAQHLRAAESTVARLRADAAAAERQAQARARRLAELEQEQARLLADLGALETTVAAARDALDAAQAARQEAEARAASREEESREVFERYNAAALAEQQARTRLDTLRRDVESTHATIREMEARQQAREARHAEVGREQEAAQAARARTRAALDAKATEREPLEQAVQQAEDALLDLQAALSGEERALREARSRRDARVREAHEKAVRLAEVQTRLQTLEADFQDTFDAPLVPDPDAIPDGFDPAEARAEVQELRRKIAALGSVNALALEQYEEEKTRLDFLLAQQHDLEQAETSLLDTIDEINTEAARRFRQTYAEIEASFSDLFRELFGPEARATLTLADPSDPLESAIEIFARPGGKRPSAITQLSGGEKTLTAIALLFSIYLVKPSPFCILDEVDAPLDEANVDRFMRLIRRFSEKTQFILVTHNKRTMELADRLYGVTMQEPGVSKTVTVRFDEATEVAAAENT